MRPAPLAGSRRRADDSCTNRTGRPPPLADGFTQAVFLVLAQKTRSPFRSSSAESFEAEISDKTRLSPVVTTAS